MTNQRLETGAPIQELLSRLHAACDPTQYAQYAERVSRLKAVKRPNDLVYFAAELGYGRVIRALLAMGFSPNTFDQWEPPLIVAAREGHVEAVNELIAGGARVNIRDENMGTPLINAAAAGRVETVKTLLEHEAKPDLQDDQGQSAILVAFTNGQDEVVEMLRPVVKASGAKIIERLRAQGGLMTRDIDRQLHEAIRDAIRLKTRAEKLPRVRELLEQGANPNSFDESGMTPLMECNITSRSEIAELFLEFGASVDCVDAYNQSVLDWAAYRCDDAIYEKFWNLASQATRRKADRIKKKLIKTGQWERTSRARRPISKSPELSAVRMVLEAGIDPNTKTESGKTLLDIVRDQQGLDPDNKELQLAAKLLIDAGAKSSS